MLLKIKLNQNKKFNIILIVSVRVDQSRFLWPIARVKGYKYGK